MAVSWYEDNSIETYDGVVFDEDTSPQITLLGKGMTFPFLTRDVVQTNVNNPYFSFQLRFNEVTTVTVDYGDGNIGRFTPQPYLTDEYRIVWTANEYISNNFTDPAFQTIYNYSSGNAETEREVKIYFRKKSLTGLLVVGSAIGFKQDLQFKFSDFRNLSVFQIDEAIINNALLGTLSPYTNSLIDNLSLRFFSDESPYYILLPPLWFLMTPSILQVGTAGWVNAVDAEDTNLHLLAMNPVGGSITSLYIVANDFTGDLPANFSDLNLLNELRFNTAHTVLPAAVKTIPNLGFLRLGAINLTSWGATNYFTGAGLYAIHYDNVENASTIGLPALIPANTRDIRQFIYSNNSCNSVTKTDAIIADIYNYIVTNASENPTITMSVTNSTVPISGTIADPGGAPTDSGGRIWDLIENYNAVVNATFLENQ